jgi:hypothetical protein
MNAFTGSQRAAQTESNAPLVGYPRRKDQRRIPAIFSLAANFFLISLVAYVFPMEPEPAAQSLSEPISVSQTPNRFYGKK